MKYPKPANETVQNDYFIQRSSVKQMQGLEIRQSEWLRSMEHEVGILFIIFR